tara:strand:+ start:119 stop:538 length:420 start_codon:yes stop_codon:yes gene_type:complete
MSKLARKTRVLIVDDDVSVLDGLRRGLRRYAAEWDISFAQDAAEALMTAKLRPLDVVITDMRMPNMRGGDLLRRFAERYPETLRIAFSDKFDALTTYTLTDCSHTFIAKPCDALRLYHFVQERVAEHLGRVVHARDRAR